MFTTNRTCAAIVGLLLSCPLTSHAVSVENAVMEWNQIALAATVTAGQGPIPQVRSMTVVQVSVHDAVNAITRKHPTYLSQHPAPAGASPDAAAIAAAHTALVTLFPTQVGALDAARAASLAARGLTETDPGIQVGDNAAAAILAARANDGASLAQFPYTAPGAGTPGVWVAIGTTPPLLPGWGHVAPWVIHSGAQFRPDQTRWARASEARSRGSSSITRCGEVVESADRRGLTSLRQRSGGPPKRLRAKAEAPALQFDLSRNALDQTVE